jgi:hypothetical protein
MSRLFRKATAAYSSKQLTRTLDALAARGNDPEEPALLTTLQHEAVQAIAEHMNHLSIDQCVRLYQDMQTGRRFDFLQRSDGDGFPAYNATLDGLQARALNRFHIKHPLNIETGHYRDGSYRKRTCTPQETLERMRPLLEAAMPRLGTRPDQVSPHHATFQALWDSIAVVDPEVDAAPEAGAARAIAPRA